jgi:hypothetical protein
VNALPTDSATTGTPVGPADDLATVRPGDLRYPGLTAGHNRRFTSNPDYVVLATSTEQTVRAVSEAVATGRRLSVVSGGHCFADFAYHAEVQAIIDTSPLDDISYDPQRGAFAVGAGAQLLNLYETLYKGWGVTLPGGTGISTGIAGHATGGGYGFLSRAHGIVADHIEAVEVVVVDAQGRAHAVVASRDPADPHHDLWWAHTGGGGGNFGVVTKFWFRSPTATGDQPGDALVRPPAEVLFSVVPVPWNRLDENGFTRLTLNFGEFQEQHAAPGDPYTGVSGFVLLNHRSAGTVMVLAQTDATIDGAGQRHGDFLAAITKGVDAATAAGGPALRPDLFFPNRMPWMASAELVATSQPAFSNPTLRAAVKSAFFRRSMTSAQAAHLYRQLTREDFANPNAMVALPGFVGGQVNAVSPDATAWVHRDSAFVAQIQSFWPSSAADAANLGWLRDVYSGLFPDTGGYPVSNDQTDGCYVSTPDTDIVDPQQNRSGVPWQTLYYGVNYPRLQRIKAEYDPLNVFRHSQSITATA